MRIAVLQIVLDPTSRAGNVQRIGASIDAAADTVPSPDLIALPGACDTGGAESGSGWNAASLTAVRERIAWKAKEWGVYIAAGLHRRQGDSFAPWNVLLDPDGDVAADTGRDESGAADPSLRSAATSLGRIAVTDLFDLRGRAAAKTDGSEEDAVVVAPLTSPAGTKARRSVAAVVADLRNGAEAAARSFLIVAASGATRANAANGTAVPSFVRGADGVIIAEADGMAEQILHVEVARVEP